MLTLKLCGLALVSLTAAAAIAATWAAARPGLTPILSVLATYAALKIALDDEDDEDEAAE